MVMQIMLIENLQLKLKDLETDMKKKEALVKR
jgi:hypothetical protein